MCTAPIVRHSVPGTTWRDGVTRHACQRQCKHVNARRVCAPRHAALLLRRDEMSGAYAPHGTPLTSGLANPRLSRRDEQTVAFRPIVLRRVCVPMRGCAVGRGPHKYRHASALPGESWRAPALPDKQWRFLLDCSPFASSHLKVEGAIPLSGDALEGYGCQNASGLTICVGLALCPACPAGER